LEESRAAAIHRLPFCPELTAEGRFSYRESRRPWLRLFAAERFF
jgi:hypothetical protein